MLARVFMKIHHFAFLWLKNTGEMPSYDCQYFVISSCHAAKSSPPAIFIVLLNKFDGCCNAVKDSYISAVSFLGRKCDFGKSDYFNEVNVLQYVASVGSG
jgi:hypothetical protein